MEGFKTLFQEAIIGFADLENCKRVMVQLRSQDGVVKCPRCGAEKVTFLAKTRVWKCYAKHASPTLAPQDGTLSRILRSVWTSGFRPLSAPS